MLTHGKYLLDTDVCIALIKGQHGIQERIRDINPMDIKISDKTLFSSPAIQTISSVSQT